MKSAVLVIVILSFFASTAFCEVVPKTQLPQMKPLLYEAWGFQLEVPRQSQRKVIPPHDDVELTELHVNGEYIYLVMITKTPPSTLTSTAIEQNIQAEYNYASRLGSVKRWEMTSRKNDLFKGTCRSIRPEEDMPDAVVELNAVLKGRIGYVCSSSTPIGDESSPILTVGIIGFKGRDGEIENMAKYFAFGVTKLSKNEKIAPVTPPVPGKPVAPPKPKPRPVLKKGQIQLSGKVETIAEDKKSLVLRVDQILMPGQKPIILNPARNKEVIVKKLPAEVVVGVDVVAIGKNEGLGTPLQADYFEVCSIKQVPNADKMSAN